MSARNSDGASGNNVVVVRVQAPASPPSEMFGMGLPNICVPFLKNGMSAVATSPGVSNLRAGSLAIILATSAASSVGTSGRTRFSGSASREMWAW